MRKEYFDNLSDASRKRLLASADLLHLPLSQRERERLKELIEHDAIGGDSYLRNLARELPV